MILNVRGAHLNPLQWHYPMTFKPERFDPNSPLFLAPGGKPRSPYAYLPFTIGPRSCLGQTLALAEIKVLLAYIFGTFEIRPAEDDFEKKEDRFFALMTKNTLALNFKD